ncbi:MAG: hypothetical protein EA397_11280 [Deltaproteobacteria bacterium]|nr:MAG: hypothetical protein EA397_11280 [Deltaproteobacteria bacterium]
MHMPLDRFVLGAAVAGLVTLTIGCQQEYGLTGQAPNVHPDDVTDCGFTPISGTKLSRYDCNPVFSGTDEGWGSGVGSVGFHATEVLGHPFYQMWYTSRPEGAGYGEWALGYAISAEGTDWQAHAQNPLIQAQPGQWDEDSFAGPVVVWDPQIDQYVMAYQGFTLGPSGVWGLGIATSPNGVSWSKHPGNPVVDFGDFGMDFSPCWPLTITLSGGGYRGYITADETDFLDELFGAEPSCNIYAMSAVDLGAWTLGSHPILEGEHWYEERGFTNAAVVEFEGVEYMFYLGFEEWVRGDQVLSAVNTNFALATSVDGGHTWHKDPGNPFPVNLTSPGRLSAIGAQVVGERIHLWITDHYEELGRSAVGYFLYEPNIDDHP